MYFAVSGGFTTLEAYRKVQVLFSTGLVHANPNIRIQSCISAKQMNWGLWDIQHTVEVLPRPHSFQICVCQLHCFTYRSQAFHAEGLVLCFALGAISNLQPRF